jgi:hypothetical protein
MSKELRADASTSGNLVIGEHLAFVRKQLVRAAVVCLLPARCPAAIAWLVIPGLIREAVEGIIKARSFAHIGEEINEAVLAQPAVANFDPEALVVCKSRWTGI